MAGSRNYWPFIVAGLFILISTGVVSASFISMQTEVTDLVLEDGAGQSTVRLQNLGDEAAFDVSLSFSLPEGFLAEDIYVGRLAPNAPVEAQFTITAQGDLMEGAYPAVLVVKYSDANSYPFSALTPFTIIYGRRTSSNVFGTIQELTLFGSKKEDLALHVRNPDDRSHELLIRLHLPRELTAEETSKTLTIAPAEERTIAFRVSSFSALPGSTYGVFATIQYSDGEAARSTTARGTIKVERDKPFFTQRRLSAALIALILLYIVYQFGARKWIKKE